MMRDEEFTFAIVADSEGDILHIRIGSDVGEIALLGVFEVVGRSVFAREMHIGSAGVGPNELGTGMLRRIACAAMKKVDCDEIIIEGARRTTGAGPGRSPKPIRFSRERCD